MIGSTVSHYRICEAIGRGGFSEVYLAKDLNLERQVVIKFLLPFLHLETQARRKFIAEAKSISALEHPRIGVIYEIDWNDSGLVYMVMAYYSGGSIRDLMDLDPLPILQALDLMLQILDGMKAAHDRGIVHRGLKPSNIMLSANRTIRIIDFGMAELPDPASLNKAEELVGTVAYLSPEQIEGKVVDARSDIFSLGIIFFEMLTGEMPFPGDNGATAVLGIITKKPKPLSAFLDEIPRGLQQILDQALTKEINGRYQSVGQMRHELVAVRDQYIKGRDLKMRLMTFSRRWRRRLQ